MPFGKLAHRRAFARTFAGPTLAQVYGAISIYLDHQSEVDAYLVKRKASWDELERQGTPLSPELKARMERARERRALLT